MKLYSKKYHRNVERQIHFGVGNGTRTVCGLILFSRHVMVSLHSGNNGAIITDDLSRVTCKRCLATRETRLRKLIAIEGLFTGIFDHDTLCGEQWLLNHALDVSQQCINAQKLEVSNGLKKVTLFNEMTAKDRKYLLKNLSRISKEECQLDRELLNDGEKPSDLDCRGSDENL